MCVSKRRQIYTLDIICIFYVNSRLFTVMINWRTWRNTSSGHLVYTYIRASVVALHATVTADISFYVWHTLYSNIDTILLLKNLHFQKYINYIIFIYHLSVLVRDASLADLRYLFLDKYQFRRATGDLNKVSTFKSNIYLFPIFVRFLTRYFSPVF